MRGKCDYSRCLLGGIHIKNKKKNDRVFPLTDLILWLIWFCIWTQHPASASTKLGLFSVLSLFFVEGRHLVCIRSPSAVLQLQQEDCVISSPQASWSCLVPERNTSPSPWSPQHVTVLSVMEAPVAPHTELETLLQIHYALCCSSPPTDCTRCLCNPLLNHNTYIPLIFGLRDECFLVLCSLLLGTPS